MCNMLEISTPPMMKKDTQHLKMQSHSTPLLPMIGKDAKSWKQYEVKTIPVEMSPINLTIPPQALYKKEENNSVNGITVAKMTLDEDLYSDAE